MRKIISSAQQCTKNGRGHHVHYFAARARANDEFCPAEVTWELGTRKIRIKSAGQDYVAYHHDPLDIARAISEVGSENVSFSLTHYWLKVQVGQNSIKFFSLSAAELTTCLELN